MPLSAPVARRLKVAGLAAGAILLAFLLAGLLLLRFGWGLLLPVAEARLSAVTGRPVVIAHIARVGGGLFHPVLEAEDVRVAQADWTGRGDVLRLRRARMRIAALPLLVGHLRPDTLELDGLRLSLVRREDGQGNWQAQGKRGPPDITLPLLRQATLRDGFARFEDRRSDKLLRIKLEVDASGMRASGFGRIGTASATIEGSGAPLTGSTAWPFRMAIRAPTVTLEATGRMRTPLDISHFTADVRSHGASITDLNQIIDTGLPATQPYDLRAAVTHDVSAWIIRGLRGEVGRSDVQADINLYKRPEHRTELTGSFVSTGLDFDDLGTDAQIAAGRALSRRLGPRLIPPTKIDLSKLRRLDGVLHVDLKRILSRDPSAVRAGSGTLTLDNGVLTIAPMRVTLRSGVVTGSAIVRHRSGSPLLLLDLRLSGARLERLFLSQKTLAGPFAGHAILRGSGGTIREALGRANGRVGAVSQGGTMTRRVALFVGSDVGRGLFEGNSERTGVRCIVGDMAVRGGIARPAPLVIDTGVARADGSGTVRLADERIAIDLAGTPKKKTLLRLNGPVLVRGALEQPTFNPPPATKTVGGLLKMVGKALGGKDHAVASDADCAGLARRALR